MTEHPNCICSVANEICKVKAKVVQKKKSPDLREKKIIIKRGYYMELLASLCNGEIQMAAELPKHHHDDISRTFGPN